MNDPTPDDIDGVVETVHNQLPWVVTDWTHTNTPREPAQLEVELEWKPTSAIDDEGEIRRELIEHVQYLDDGSGAPTEVVIEDTLEHYNHVTEREVTELLEQLKQEGEIYEPRTDHLRSVNG